MIIRNLYKRLSRFFSSDKEAGELKNRKNHFLTIEFIGPSGVGKTTLYNNCKDRLKLNWTAKNEITSSLNSDRLLPVFWKLINLKIKSLDFFVESKETRYILLQYLINELHIENKIQSIKSVQNFILEEGICHNFSRELIDLNNNEFSTLLKNRAIIYIKPKNALTVVERLEKRRLEGGHVVVYHQGVNKEGLLNITKRTIANFDSFIEKFKKHSQLLLVLEAEDSNEINIEKVVQFEKFIISTLK